MREHQEVDAERVLAALAAKPYPLSLRELARELDLHGSERKQLKKALRRLQEKKRVVEVGGSRYLLAERHRVKTGTGNRETGIVQGITVERRARPTVHGSRVAGLSRVPLGGARGHELTGRLVAHRDGYGFVIPDEPIAGLEGDIFIPPPALADAMHGDRVAVRPSARRRGDKMEGRIVRVLERAHPTLVGQFHFAQGGQGDRNNYVQPYDARIRQPVIIPPGEEVPLGYRGARKELEGALVNVELTRFPSATGEPPRGRILEVLGHTGDLGLDVKVIIRKYHLPEEFPPEVQRAAERIPQTIDPAEAARREDFRHLPVVTIDGEDAKDFDDAVYVERPEASGANGHWLLQVHIADVSHYVRPGTPLDREARLRGNSVYFPDRALPMLPVELSNGICSLNPKVDRLVLSALMEIDGNGRTVRFRLADGVVHSAARMTYTAVNAILSGDAAVRQQYAPLVPEFEKMQELAGILTAARERRGSIDFDLPEALLRFDAEGQISGIARSERNVAHRLIEEFMLAANETVARFLAARLLALYRVHEPPDPRRVLEFEEIAASFGYSLGLAPARVHRVRLEERPGARRGRGRGRERVLHVPERLDVTPRHYQRLTDRIAGKPEERILSYLMLRSLKQARYAEENFGHFALATDCYTHFTSPIRRYPDLIVHRLVRHCLRTMPEASLAFARDKGGKEAGRQGRKEFPEAGAWGLGARKGDGPVWLSHPGRLPEKPPSAGPIKREELRAIAMECSETERRADDAERELIDLKKLDFMEQHLGDEFDALVISMNKYGFWVELFDLFVEGFVPVESIDPGARYSFHESPPRLLPARSASRTVHGSRSTFPAFHLGDRVRVRLDRVDRTLNKLQFSYLSHLQPVHHAAPKA